MLVSTSVSGQRTTIIGHRHRHRHHLNLQLLKRASPHPEKTDDALGDKPTDGAALMTALRFPSLSFAFLPHVHPASATRLPLPFYIPC